LLFASTTRPLEVLSQSLAQHHPVMVNAVSNKIQILTVQVGYILIVLDV